MIEKKWNLVTCRSELLLNLKLLGSNILLAKKLNGSFTNRKCYKCNNSQTRLGSWYWIICNLVP